MPHRNEPSTQFIVFADDWGRHPSSSQHLVRELLPQYPTLWVNTIGTRRPGLNLTDISRGAKRLRQWLPGKGKRESATAEDLNNLTVIAPRMYPGFRSAWQRRLNTHQVSKAVARACETQSLTPGGGNPRALERVVVTTLPITADLVGKLDADRWIYYCVDDYSQWPGTDHAVMDAMERELVAKVDAVVCVSETLQDRMASMGRSDSTLLTHGVDVEQWEVEPSQDAARIQSDTHGFFDLNGSPITFWGLIDDRLDLDWIAQLRSLSGSPSDRTLKVCLVGPMVGEKSGWESQARRHPDCRPLVCCGEVDYSELPKIACFSSVLIMPYIDAPVTRAMQPLKLKEYLATMKPVVVRDLPSTRLWADCCDVVATAEAFASKVIERAKTGTPECQIAARKKRLANESWATKASQLSKIIDQPNATMSE